MSKVHPIKVVVCDKEMNGAGNKKRKPWVTCWGTRVVSKREAHTWVYNVWEGEIMVLEVPQP